MNGTTVANIYKKCCNLPKITGVTANGNIISVIGLDLDLDTKEKVIKELNKNNISFSNIDKHSMSISITINEENINKCIMCLHSLFFKVGGSKNE